MPVTSRNVSRAISSSSSVGMTHAPRRESSRWLGLELDPELNATAVNGNEGPIHREGSRLGVWVIPTDEELLLARDTFRLVTGMEARY